jgi:hypothetical protein
MHHENEVRLIAYELWENDGRPDGRDLDHWLQAEAIWAERQLPQLEETASKPSVKKARRTTTTKRRTTSRRPPK